MTTTTILVWTSAKSAVRKCCQHGWHKIPVDAAALTPEQRELLAQRVLEQDGARYHAPNGPYDVAPPTQEGLVAHLQAALDARAEKAREQAEQDARVAERKAELAVTEDAELDRELERLRSAPVDELLYGKAHKSAYHALHGYAYTAAKRRWSDLDHLRVSALVGREAEVEAELVRRNAEAEAEAAAERKAKAERKIAEHAQLRAIVREHAALLLPLLDEGCARGEDLDQAVTLWACERLALRPDDLTPVKRYRQRDELTRQEWDARTELRRRAARLGDPTVEVGIADAFVGASQEASGRVVACVVADIAGRRIELEMPPGVLRSLHGIPLRAAEGDEEGVLEIDGVEYSVHPDGHGGADLHALGPRRLGDEQWPTVRLVLGRDGEVYCCADRIGRVDEGVFQRLPGTEGHP